MSQIDCWYSTDTALAAVFRFLFYCMLSVQPASISTYRLFVRLSVDDIFNVDIGLDIAARAAVDVPVGVVVGIAYRRYGIEVEMVCEERWDEMR